MIPRIAANGTTRLGKHCVGGRKALVIHSFGLGLASKTFSPRNVRKAQVLIIILELKLIIFFEDYN